MEHYGLKMEKINAGKAHENGDAEQSHHRFKEAVDQALLLRGSRDFRAGRPTSDSCGKCWTQRNAGRQKRPSRGASRAAAVAGGGGWRATSERGAGRPGA